MVIIMVSRAICMRFLSSGSGHPDSGKNEENALPIMRLVNAAASINADRV